MLSWLVVAGLSAGPAESGDRPDWLDDVESWEAGPESESETETEREAAPPESESEPESEPEPGPDTAGTSGSEAERGAPSESSPDIVIGALRLVGAFLYDPDGVFDSDALLSAVGRVVVQHPVTDHVSYELNVFSDVSRAPGPGLAGTFATAGSFNSPYRYPLAVISMLDDGDVTAQAGIDRFVWAFRWERVSFELGRQPVNYAVAQIFTPNDFFAPFSATAVNRVYKPGVDAARLGIGLGELSSVEVVGVLGWNEAVEPTWGRSAVLVRPSVVLWNFEWAALGGKLAERWVVGASMQGDAGPIGLRSEAHVGFPDRDGDGVLDDDRDVHVRLSAGPNININWQSITLGAEYAFFSDGEPEPAGYIPRFFRRFPDDLPYLGRHYVGVNAGLEATSLLRLTTIALVNATDGSGLAGLFGLFSIADEADLVGGLFVPWGRGVGPDAVALRSEFGSQPLSLFLETRVFF